MLINKKLIIFSLILSGYKNHSTILAAENNFSILRITSPGNDTSINLLRTFILRETLSNENRQQLLQKDETFSSFVKNLHKYKKFTNTDYITIEQQPIFWLFGLDKRQEIGMPLNTIISLKEKKANKEAVINQLKKQNPTEDFTPEYWEEDILSLKQAQDLLNEKITEVKKTKVITIESNPLTKNNQSQSIELLGTFVIARNFLLNQEEYSYLTKFLRDQTIPKNIIKLENPTFIKDKTATFSPQPFCITEENLQKINEELYDFFLAAQKRSIYINNNITNNKKKETPSDDQVKKTFESGSTEEKAELFSISECDKKNWPSETKKAHDDALHNFEKQIWKALKSPKEENTIQDFRIYKFDENNKKQGYYLTKEFKNKKAKINKPKKHSTPSLFSSPSPKLGEKKSPNHPNNHNSEKAAPPTINNYLVPAGCLAITAGIALIWQLRRKANKANTLSKKPLNNFSKPTIPNYYNRIPELKNL